MKKLFSLAIISLTLGAAQAQKVEIPSHCIVGEVSLLDANMGTGKYTNLKPNGKVLSLCADRGEPPFNRIAYRYGKVGAVELEHVATAQLKMAVEYNARPRPGGGSASSSALWFQRGGSVYAITECTMGCMGSFVLTVHNGKKLVAKLSPYKDYTSSLPDIDFNKPSPALVFKEMPNNINTFDILRGED